MWSQRRGEDELTQDAQRRHQAGPLPHPDEWTGWSFDRAQGGIQSDFNGAGKYLH